MADTQENEWTPGIVVLKDVALYEPGIERLGPPPGNAGVLIRGGAAWVFGVEEKPLARGIVKLDAPPPENEVADALAREMAWRWFYGHGPFVKSPGAARGVSTMAKKFHRYAEIEVGFVEHALRLIPGMPSLRETPEVLLDTSLVVELPHACACLVGGRCCTDNCLRCGEG